MSPANCLSSWRSNWAEVKFKDFDHARFLMDLKVWLEDIDSRYNGQSSGAWHYASGVLVAPEVTDAHLLVNFLNGMRDPLQRYLCDLDVTGNLSAGRDVEQLLPIDMSWISV